MPEKLSSLYLTAPYKSAGRYTHENARRAHSCAGRRQPQCFSLPAKSILRKVCPRQGRRRFAPLYIKSAQNITGETGKKRRPANSRAFFILHCKLSLIILHGLPRATFPAGMSFVTTLPAPITVSPPMGDPRQYNCAGAHPHIFAYLHRGGNGGAEFKEAVLLFSPCLWAAFVG